jgi:hypothetical protein
MKLRIQGNSLRLRVSQSDMTRLLEQEWIAETIRFAPETEAHLTYALEHERAEREIAVRYAEGRVTVVLSTEAARRWAGSDDIGIYGEAETGGDEPLKLLVEKDFACLGGDEASNADAFPNPHAEAVC